MGRTSPSIAPSIPRGTNGFAGPQQAVLTRMVRALIETECLGQRIAWLYTPMALPLARALEPAPSSTTAWTSCRRSCGAPPQLLRARGASCWRCADVVFTGGPSLYRAKQDRHPQRALLPEQRRRRRTSRARAALPEPADQARCRARGSASSASSTSGSTSTLLDALADGAPGLADRAWSARS